MLWTTRWTRWAIRAATHTILWLCICPVDQVTHMGRQTTTWDFFQPLSLMSLWEKSICSQLETHKIVQMRTVSFRDPPESRKGLLINHFKTRQGMMKWAPWSRVWRTFHWSSQMFLRDWLVLYKRQRGMPGPFFCTSASPQEIFDLWPWWIVEGWVFTGWREPNTIGVCLAKHVSRGWPLLFFLLELEFIPSSSNNAKKSYWAKKEFGVWDSVAGPIPDPIHPPFIHLSVHPCLSPHLHSPSLSLPNSVGKLYAPLLCFHKASALILRVIKRATLFLLLTHRLNKQDRVASASV